MDGQSRLTTPACTQAGSQSDKARYSWYNNALRAVVVVMLTVRVDSLSLPILQTKLYAPRAPRPTNVVHRPRLTEQLTAGLAGKVTLIAAPAGFGKSTLLSEWLSELTTQAALQPEATNAGRARHQHVAWLTLDPDDNDPVRFLTYLIVDLQRFKATVGETAMALLASPGSLAGAPAPKTILTLLLNDLSQLADSSADHLYILVLEDYHVITAQPIHEALTYLIDHLPPYVHVIITTRADPPLPLARWRARTQLAEIRADALRFTADEVALFLNDRMGLNLATADIVALEVRTEGWIVGLQLMALSMHGRADKTNFLQTFSGGHRYILNYLIEEVLKQQSPPIQQFLLCTVILDRLCGPLCDSLFTDDDLEFMQDAVDEAGRTTKSVQRKIDSQMILEQLYHANLFLTPLDDEGQWYRYHQLFAEVLQHRLRQSQPDLLPLLHQRASRWYAGNGLFTDAIRHALQAADFVRTAELLEQIWPTMWQQGVVVTLLNWVQALPQAALAARPRLWVSYAWALAFTGQIEAAATCLRQIEEKLAEIGPVTETETATHNTLLGRAAALYAMLAARRGEPDPAIHFAQQALILMPAEAWLLRGDAYFALGLAYQQRGALPEALQAYRDATKLGMAVDDFLTIAARYHETRIYMAQGYLRMAAAGYQQMLALATQQAKPLPVVGLAYVGYAEILYQWNDLAGAAQQIETGLALSPPSELTYTDGPFHRFSILARIRQAMGDREGTLAALQAAKATARQTSIALDQARAAALEALMQLRMGQPALAYAWAQGYARTASEADLLTYLHEFETAVFIRILLAQARIDEAVTLLARWLPATEATQRLGSILEITLLQALALQAGGQTEAAARTLAHVLALAEPEGYIRLFVDEGEPIRMQIAEFGMRNLEPHQRAYVEQILSAFANQFAVSSIGEEGLAPVAESPNPKFKSANLVEPLTNRELEVLRLMAAGLSNAAIAAQLVVSVGTIKTHLKHIYGKLAVQSRTQAVAQARTRGLL